MCDECYARYGRPAVDNPAVRLAAERILAVYAANPVGGNCHIVLDDWNLEGEHIEFCLNALRTGDTWHNDPGQHEADRACMIAMRELSLEERASALALSEGRWG